ncbi:hypothetical protein N6H18_04810 [Reichenbachiella agarivorans]|uniref:Uncharacterized protein n=1 Tax=Reichenbachiella agarivorans TaxID=2979464 RepID=A0ABY6CTS1_9BACT|nr:hypothetical protein [Reichenbachiella agarivorans]UXP33269.1 hypothetical protein N6H18_04810 [Reichenbachiella agarivorans]
MNRIWILCLVATACSALEGEQKTNVNDIIKTQKIRQLNQAEVMVEAEKFGKKIDKVIDENFRSGKITCADALKNQSAVLDSMNLAMEGQIVLGFADSNFMTKQERDLYEAYLYNAENGIVSQSSIQMMDDKYALFTAPYPARDAVYTDCLPDSTAVGMWSMIIPIKTVINQLD